MPEPHKIDPHQATYDASLARCVGVRNIDPDRVATAYSQDFSSGGGSLFASSTASRYKSTSDIAIGKAEVTSAKVLPCFKSLIQSEIQTSGQLPPGSTATVKSLSITVHPSSLPSNVIAVGHAVLSVVVPIGSSHATLTASADLAFVTGKYVIAQVEMGGLGINKALESKLFSDVARRAAAA